MAAAVPSRRQISIGGTIYSQSEGIQIVARSTKQQTFAVQDTSESCEVAEVDATDKTSTASAAKSSSKIVSSSSSSSKTTAKTVSQSTSTTKTAASTKAASSTSKSTSKSASSTKTASSSASSTPTALVLTSNSASYGEAELTTDLNKILKWAGDEDNVTSDQQEEIVAALLSASARYYPEMPTQAICRIMLADIRAESDFTPTEVSGARLDSGSSWGLLQVSPNGDSQELALFQDHANVVTHNFTYGVPSSARANVRGPLLDYETGKMIVMSNLTKSDLFRPWINIHVAMWIQSNLARSSSQDPYNWSAMNDYSWALKQGSLTILTSKVASEWKSLIAGASIATTIRTGLGSWVAGPAASAGGYLQSGDDVSTAYLNSIMTGVRYLYGVTDKTLMPKAWLDTYTLNAGLVDYVPF
ncbi:hypothetical protein CBS101457_001156 [Exobasidium rhododendri]|nr:hypothetical protein CBS101457_001156 [Exobasidium rhododendri]